MTDQTDLAALLGSRICHDLISPLGAIGNGLELLELSGIDSPEVTLIREAVDDANRRIKVFRLAFGAASDTQMVKPGEIAALLPADTGPRALRVEWQADGDQPRPAVKEAFLALMCLESAMPYGGEILVRRTGAGWILAGAAERLNVDAPLWEALAAGSIAPLPAPAQLHFTLLAAALKARGATARTDISATEIGLTL
ncbi:MAG TPA: histidine phosphotransferase [Aliiroseovarius sp.]|nr:histidine phosphotransferase [Aliiroseovarius sp.]